MGSPFFFPPIWARGRREITLPRRVCAEEEAAAGRRGADLSRGGGWSGMGRRTTVVTGRGCPPGTRAPLGASRPWKLERFSFGFRGRLDSGRSSSPGQQNENLAVDLRPMSMGGEDRICFPFPRP